MHYLAPGKKNLVYHLTDPKAHAGRVLLHSPHDLNKWSVEELTKTHKEMHEPETVARNQSI